MHFQAFRETLCFALLLWVPLWWLELSRPFDPSTLLVSPISRKAWGFAGGIGLAIAVLFALVTHAMAGSENRAERVRASVVGTTVGSIAFLLGVEGIQRFAMDRSLAPHIGSLLALAAALMLAGIATWALAEALPRGARKSAGLATGALALLLWFVAVQVEIAPEHHIAHLGTIGLSALATSYLVLARGRSDADDAPRRSRPVIAASLLLPLLLALSIDERGARHVNDAVASPAANPRPNVLLVIVDTLRADHTELTRADRATELELTPGLARFARQRGTRFDAAWSAAPNTIPSMKALFTGRLSSSFGGEEQIVKHPPLAATTLAETLLRAGYATAGVTANGLVSGDGFEQGFETYWTLASHDQFIASFFLNRLLAGQRVYRGFTWMERLRIHKEQADAVTSLGSEWLRHHLAGERAARPFFLYLHLLDPHWPYHDRGMGAVPAALADLDAPFSHVDFLRLPAPHPDHAKYARDTRMQEMKGRYNDEIRAADHELEAMLAALEADGILDDTIVVIAGDHGEEFFEHFAFGHGQDVYVEELHVPLVFLWPEGARFDAMPARIDSPVSLVDVLPTLRELLELPPPGDEAALLGRSLVPLLSGEAIEARPPIVAESKDARGMRFIWRDGDDVVRFAYTETGNALATTDVSAFDQARDPRQLAPLDTASPDVVTTIERARDDVRARGLR